MIPIYDRNPTRRPPLINVALILVNVLVFAYMLFLSNANELVFVYRYAAIPWEITHGQRLPLYVIQEMFQYPVAQVPAKSVFLSILTSMFVHGGWLHIMGNMLYLWIFGNNVEDVMGHLPFLGFYLFCGICGTLLHVAVYPDSTVPMLGASGAISGVLGAYLILYPRAWIYTWFLFFIIPLPAFVVIGLWIVIQVVNGLESMVLGASGVAWFAHIGGVAAGLGITLLFYPILKRRRDGLSYRYPRHWDWE